MFSTESSYNNGREAADLIEFLNNTLPHKPRIASILTTIAEEICHLIPYEMLCFSVRQGNQVNNVFCYDENLPRGTIFKTSRQLIRRRRQVFPLWERTEEKVLEIRFFPPDHGDREEKESEGNGHGVDPVLVHSIKGSIDGLVMMYARNGETFSRRHEFLFYIIATWLVSYWGLAKIYSSLENIAVTDSLTGVFNRRKFMDEITKEVARSKRYKLNLSVIILDIDNLKSINDSLGHSAGDELLKKCVNLTSGSIRSADTLSRIGGDEFGLILPHTSIEGAKVLNKRLLSTYEKSPLVISDNKYDISVSSGITSFHRDDTPKDLFERADTGLLCAKKENKGGYWVIVKG